MKPIIILMHGEISAGYLLTVFENLNIPYQICNTANGDIPPEDMHTLGGAVIMGGMMAIYEQDKYPWLSREIGWVERFLETEKPILGICLGCQMLAYIYDSSSVHSGEKGLNVGFKPVEVISDDPVFGQELTGCYVPLYHGDTYVLSENAKRLARGSFYYEQAAKFTENVYGTQFHPEVTKEIIQEWYHYAQSDARPTKNVPALEDFLLQAEKHLPKTQSWLEKFIGRLFVD